MVSLHAQRRVVRDAESTYDEIAPDYERHLQDDCRYRSPERVATALAKLPAQGRWLDLGAGTGLLGAALAQHDLDVELVAVDVSSVMLEQIASRLYVETHHADVLKKLPVPKHSCDGVVAVGLFEYVVDVERLIKRARAALVGGGWFVFTFCPNTEGTVAAFDEEADLHSHDGDLVERMLELAGFVIRKRKEFRAYVNGDQGWIRHRLLLTQAG